MAHQKKMSTPTSGHMYMAAIVTLLFVVLFEYIFDTQLTSILTTKRVLTHPEQDVQNNMNMTRKFDPTNPAIPILFVELLKDKIRSRAFDKIKLTDKRTIKIVVHYPTHGMLRRDPLGVDMSKCIYNNCHVTVSKETKGADAVILQGSKPTKPLPVRESPDQVFIFASLETPVYLNFVNLYAPFWKSVYNWSLTYRTDADIPYIYGYIVPSPIPADTVFVENEMSDGVRHGRDYLEFEEAVFRNPVGLANKNYSDIFRRKNVTASWLVSHCKTASKRENYVKIMSKTIDIDIFGKCNKRKCARDFEVCDKKIITYSRFYLSFENSLCTDYITEKAFKWFEQDIVIVVRGAREYGYHLPKGTYIDAEDFSSPTELALYLRQLSDNEQKYIKYLKRKDMYKVFQRDFSAKVAYCNICRKLNNLKTYKKSLDLNQSWLGDACINPFPNNKL